jgi:integrase
MKGLYQRGKGNYYADIIINGKRLCKSLKTKNYSQAVVSLQKLIDEENEKALDMFSGFGGFDEAPMVLSEALERTVEERFNGYADGKTAKAHIEALIRIIGDIELSALTKNHVSVMGNTLKSQGRTETTVNRYMGHLRVLLHLARDEWGVIKKFPNIPKYKEKGTRMYILTTEDEKRLLKWFKENKLASRNGQGLDGWHYAHLMILLLDTGLRLSEGLSLRVSDVREGRVHVRQEVAKSGVARFVPLSERAAEVVKERLALTDGEPTSLLFGKMKKDAAGKRMRIAKASLKLDHTDLGWHSLRHTCATRLLKAGADIVTVQTWLGHADILTTRRYLKYVDGAMEDALSKMSQMYNGEDIN